MSVFRRQSVGALDKRQLTTLQPPWCGVYIRIRTTSTYRVGEGLRLSGGDDLLQYAFEVCVSKKRYFSPKTSRKSVGSLCGDNGTLETTTVSTSRYLSFGCSIFFATQTNFEPLVVEDDIKMISRVRHDVYYLPFDAVRAYQRYP